MMLVEKVKRHLSSTYYWKRMTLSNQPQIKNFVDWQKFLKNLVIKREILARLDSY